MNPISISIAVPDGKIVRFFDKSSESHIIISIQIIKKSNLFARKWEVGIDVDLSTINAILYFCKCSIGHRTLNIPSKMVYGGRPVNIYLEYMNGENCFLMDIHKGKEEESVVINEYAAKNLCKFIEGRELSFMIYSEIEAYTI